MNKINTIGIIGYGRFGKFLHKILREINKELRFEIYDSQKVLENSASIKQSANSDLVFVSVPIREFENVIKTISNTITSDSIVVDVCSVKVYPKKIMLQNLPKDVQFIATHPMFGPGDFKNKDFKRDKLKGKRWVVDKVRITNNNYELFIDLLKKLKVDIIEMSSEDHDKIAANTQFPTLFTTFFMKEQKIKRTKINTATSDVMIDLMNMVTVDKSLLKDIYLYNPHCKKTLDKIKESFINLNIYLLS